MEVIMSQKTVLWIAAALTAFVLVVGGALAGRIRQAPRAANATATANVEAVILQREAEYQALIKQANDQLAEAYKNPPPAVPQEPGAQPAATPTPEWITPKEAMSAAVISVPGAKILRQPELIDFQGTVAYEVRLDRGVVYIDASNGALLYNGTVQQEMANNQSPAPDPSLGNGHDDDHDDDHGNEHGSDDD
jgi:uncharacterized membrane protein YkoI